MTICRFIYNDHKNNLRVLSLELGYLFKDNYKILIKIEDKDMDKCRDFDSFRED